jgi:peptidase E
MCIWRLDGPHGALIHSESPRALIGTVLPRFTGRSLTAIEIGDWAGWTRFEFDEKYHLRCLPFSQKEEVRQDGADYWMLFMPHNKVLSVRSGNRISIQRSDRVA